jgi:hypothetical protein
LRLKHCDAAAAAADDDDNEDDNDYDGDETYVVR